MAHVRHALVDKRLICYRDYHFLYRSMSKAPNNEALIRGIFDASSDAMLILSSDYAIKFLNPAAGELLEADLQSLIGEIFPFELQRDTTSEHEIPGPNNTNRLVEITAVDLIWEGNGALLVTMRDVSRRRQAELDLRREKEHLSIILDSITDAVIVIDASGNIERMNPEAEQLIGVTKDAAVGKPLKATLQLKHPKTGNTFTNSAQLLLAKEKGEIRPETGVELIKGKNSTITVSVDMSSISVEENTNQGYVILLRDMTHQKLAEDELFKTEKLQSISLLAGGIAHDFNNILTAILGNISVVRMEMADSDRHSVRLLAAEKAALQAKSLTQQLLTFSKGGTPVLETTTIRQLVEDCAELIIRGSNVRCDIEKTEETWPVDADKGQIAQVINNLLINADQSMPKGGIIKIALSNCCITDHDISTLTPGDYVSISISDQGVGISQENIKRIFDPYFTTKKDGNGLGLASSYSIVQSHHGSISVDSKVNQGSCFTIYLPRSKKNVPLVTEDSAAEISSSSQSIHKGQGRILIMDDMEAMMMVAGEIISMLGYEVAYATNGYEAIEAYKSAKEGGTPFDAVVFDLTVPGSMGGEEAAGILIQYDPDLRAIASSGYSTSNVMSDYQDSPFTAVVPKPYRIKEMSDALHMVLNLKKTP